MTRQRPELVLLDVNETLTDLTGLRPRFVEVGAPGHLLETWFAGVLRDGFALALTGGYADFRALAAAGLTGLLARVDGLDRPASSAADHVLDGMPDLPLHPDVVPGLRRLSDRGVRLVACTNGNAATAAGVLERGGVADLDDVLSVAEAQVWKPHPRAYAWAVQRCAGDPATTALLATHPWDVAGAQAAGLTGAWVSRGAAWPDPLGAPQVQGDDLSATAEALLALPTATPG